MATVDFEKAPSSGSVGDKFWGQGSGWDIRLLTQDTVRLVPGEGCRERMVLRIFRGFPGGAVVENLPANAGDTGSSPGLGRSHMLRSN